MQISAAPGCMGVNEAGIDGIMDLVDQLHGLRMAMRDLISAVGNEAPR
nr:hypothetical protein [Rhizobium leguminosarum]